jgi:hypothetical protein
VTYDRRRLKIFKFFSVVGGGGSDPRALRRRRLDILSWSAAAAGKFKNEEFFRK